MWGRDLRILILAVRSDRRTGRGVRGWGGRLEKKNMYSKIRYFWKRMKWYVILGWIRKTTPSLCVRLSQITNFFVASYLRGKSIGRIGRVGREIARGRWRVGWSRWWLRGLKIWKLTVGSLRKMFLPWLFLKIRHFFRKISIPVPAKCRPQRNSPNPRARREARLKHFSGIFKNFIFFLEILPGCWLLGT